MLPHKEKIVLNFQSTELQVFIQALLDCHALSKAGKSHNKSVIFCNSAVAMYKTQALHSVFHL